MKTFSYLQKQHKLQARNAMQRNMYKWQNNYKYAKIFNLNAKLVINYIALIYVMNQLNINI